MKRALALAALCFALGAAVDRFVIQAAVSQPAPKPTYTMPNDEPGQGGMGEASLNRIKSSPRHQELIDIKIPGQEKPMKTFIVHPERKDKAPVVICIMEVFGMSD